ncbi:hypothetical protein [Nannocystis sp.]|uniref:hypothetical protein n=1 Tax=Nannocystis sp. TaxID=1962667 RepID=UPI0025DF34B9|nr:hypothetical protein [Nannocystis sp.]MBK7823724.1 hypothetical protein [Nannocystis sp.]
MRPTTRGKLCVPALLAVTTIAAPACTEKPTTSSSDSSSGAQTGTDSTPTTGPTTGPTTTGNTGNTGTDGLTTGALPDCAPLPDMATCEAETGCFWFEDLGECIVDCTKLTDEATCVGQPFCSWFDEMCSLVLA